MSTEALDRTQPATAGEHRARINRLQEVMKAVMKDGTHFGVIPGTPKPTLYKAGSEVILATFRIAVDPVVEDLSTPDCARYRVLCRGITVSGELVGTGVGEASSDEEKYRWRKAVCDQEWDETDPDRRRAKWSKSGNSAYQTKQVRTSPADVANTVLKMAKKRAQIDLTLTATAASDVFSQDIEDLPAELRETADDAKPAMQGPRAKDEPAKASPAGEGVTVTAYSQKTGKTAAGKPWVLHIATFSDGREASTFHESIGALLARSKDHGVALDVVTEPSQKNPDKLTITAAEVVQ